MDIGLEVEQIDALFTLASFGDMSSLFSTIYWYMELYFLVFIVSDGICYILYYVLRYFKTSIYLNDDMIFAQGTYNAWTYLNLIVEYLVP